MTWGWATVTGTAPLRVRVDGDTTPLDVDVVDHVAGLTVGARVRYQLDGVLIITGAGVSNRMTRVAVSQRTSNTSNALVAYNITTVTIPQSLTRTGRVFRITGSANINPDTAGMFTDLALLVGAGITTAGTQIAGSYIDHRAVGRIVGGTVYASWTYDQTVNVANMNIALVGIPGGGGSSVNANIARPAILTVDTVG